MSLSLGLVAALALPACTSGPVAADAERALAPASSSTGDASGTTSGPGMCAPEPDANACIMCLDSSCCAQKQACEANQDCACILSCLSSGASPLCAQCTASPASAPTIGALFMCMGPKCEAQCG